jgi:hypothetical protein
MNERAYRFWVLLQLVAIALGVYGGTILFRWITE